jgi:hypothetical protein
MKKKFLEKFQYKHLIEIIKILDFKILFLILFNYEKVRNKECILTKKNKKAAQLILQNILEFYLSRKRDLI